jgi:hypothetical protein
VGGNPRRDDSVNEVTITRIFAADDVSSGSVNDQGV